MAVTRHTWASTLLGHPGLVLQAAGSLTVGGHLYAAGDAVNGIRLSPFTINKVRGAGEEVTGISDHGTAFAFKFDPASRTWLQKFGWDPRPAGHSAGAFRLISSGDVSFIDGTVAKAGTPFLKRLTVGGSIVDVQRSAGSALLIEQCRSTRRLYTWERGVWYELLAYFPAAVAVVKPARPASPPTAIATPVALPRPPRVLWQRYTIENLFGSAGIGDAIFLDDGSIVLGSRTFAGGSEVNNHRFGGYVANRNAGTDELLVIDKPDGESLYVGRHLGTWHRFAPMPGVRAVFWQTVTEDLRQFGPLAVVKWAFQFIGALILLGLVTVACGAFLGLVYGAFGHGA